MHMYFARPARRNLSGMRMRALAMTAVENPVRMCMLSTGLLLLLGRTMSVVAHTVLSTGMLLLLLRTMSVVADAVLSTGSTLLHTHSLLLLATLSAVAAAPTPLSEQRTMPQMAEMDGHMLPVLPIIGPDSPPLSRSRGGQAQLMSVARTEYDHTSNLQLRARLASSELGAGNTYGSDIWGCEKAGVELALMTFSKGLAVVDVTKPSAPVFRGYVGKSGWNSIWKDVKCYGEKAFLVRDGASSPNEVVVVDIAPAFAGSSISGSYDTHTIPAYTAHNVAINMQSGFLYLLGVDGIKIYDISSGFEHVANCVEWGYVHDAEIVSFTSGPHAGKEIAFATRSDSGGSSFTTAEGVVLKGDGLMTVGSGHLRL